MYRYTVDNAVTYTSEDVVLFRESPFACWMERLTVENPDHGIPPDIGSEAPRNTMESQEALARTLRAEGRDVVLVPWADDEPARRSATLAAMRQGADFIVDGQLSLGPLSGSANLLMRTSGYSELGNYLYIPCDTQGHTTVQNAFRLCFLADLLHDLQGQLPPQMLIIRGSGDLVPMQTEDHIYHYRAVKQRFMSAMREFRKHRMPDPAESSHFGRWSECAHEVLRQRALRGEPAEESQAQERVPEPEPRVANAEPVVMDPAPQPQPSSSSVGGTLAEQARQLNPGSYSTERQPPSYSRGQGVTADNGSLMSTPTEPPLVTRPAPDPALENLEFIGRRPVAPRPARPVTPPPMPTPEPMPEPVPEPVPEPRQAPPPNLASEPPPVTLRRPLPKLDESEPVPDSRRPHPLDSSEPAEPEPLKFDAVIDRDDIRPPAERDETPAPTLQTGSREFEVDCFDDSDYRLPGEPPRAAEPPPSRQLVWEDEEEVKPDETALENRPFNSSLITNDELDD